VITKGTDTMGIFTLPETNAALARWRELTGLDEASSEWGEVYQVLKDTELLAADRSPQRGLFDNPDQPLGDTAEVIALRLAIVGGATLARHIAQENGWPLLGVATATAIVAALLGQFYDLSGLTFEQALLQLETELPKRALGVSPAPSMALMWQAEGTMAMAKLGATSLATQVLRAAFDDDEFAVRVFDRTAQNPEYHLAVAPLCTGSWLVYDSARTL
jgi:hypothetical protein